MNKHNKITSKSCIPLTTLVAYTFFFLIQNEILKESYLFFLYIYNNNIK